MNEAKDRIRDSRDVRLWIRRALFAALPVALLAGAYEYVTGGQAMSTENAYIEADKVGISTDVSGVVATVEAHENQTVPAGAVLFRLDDLQFRLALGRAEAQIGVIRNTLNALKASYRDMQAQIEQAQLDIDYFSTEAQRQADLLQEHVASQSAYDAAHRNLQTARHKLTSLEEQLAAIAANLNDAPAGPVELNPRYLDAVAQRDEAARQLSHVVVRAPFAGVVTDVPSTAPGKYLPASNIAFYLVSTDHVWIDANPKETELTYVLPQQQVTVAVDSYPGVQWRGVVDSISPAASQEFSLLPAQNTSGNWVKVVQRIPLRVRVDTTDRRLPVLRAGASVEISVNTGHARGFPHFLTGLFGRHRQDG